MIIYFACLLVMTALGAIASLFLKKASGADSVIALLKNKSLYVGAFLYLSASILNIWVLKYLDYSVVLPLTSLTYIWTMALSYFVLGEKITGKKIIGVIMILVGAVCVSIQ